VPAEVHGDLHARVQVEGPVQTQLGAVRVTLDDVELTRRGR
jgi:hypothetical protein